MSLATFQVGGAGSDVLRGGGARDTFVLEPGSDTYAGGDGSDSFFSGLPGAAVSVTLDNVANDGAAGESDNVGADIEDVYHFESDPITIVAAPRRTSSSARREPTRSTAGLATTCSTVSSARAAGPRGRRWHCRHAGRGCSAGVVSVQVKRGATTLSTRRTNLRRNCTYSSSVTFTNRRRLGSSGRLRFTARFLGNAVLTRATAPTRTAGAG